MKIRVGRILRDKDWRHKLRGALSPEQSEAAIERAQQITPDKADICDRYLIEAITTYTPEEIAGVLVRNTDGGAASIAASLCHPEHMEPPRVAPSPCPEKVKQQLDDMAAAIQLEFRKSLFG